jgi:hypothetical protein
VTLLETFLAAFSLRMYDVWCCGLVFGARMSLCSPTSLVYCTLLRCGCGSFWLYLVAAWHLWCMAWWVVLCQGLNFFGHALAMLNRTGGQALDCQLSGG